VAQLRIYLQVVDSVSSSLQNDRCWTDEEYQRYKITEAAVIFNLNSRLHAVYDHIDAQAAEIKRLQEELETAKNRNDVQAYRVIEQIEYAMDNAPRGSKFLTIDAILAAYNENNKS